MGTGGVYRPVVAEGVSAHGQPFSGMATPLMSVSMSVWRTPFRPVVALRDYGRGGCFRRVLGGAYGKGREGLFGDAIVNARYVNFLPFRQRVAERPPCGSTRDPGYPPGMCSCGRLSDRSGLPHWIPHGTPVAP